MAAGVKPRGERGASEGGASERGSGHGVPANAVRLRGSAAVSFPRSRAPTLSDYRTPASTRQSCVAAHSVKRVGFTPYRFALPAMSAS